MLRNRPRVPPEQPSNSPGSSSSMPNGQAGAYPGVPRRGLFLPMWVFNIAPLLIIVGLILELSGPANLKPSVVLGGALGSAESTKIKTELAAVQANLAAQNEENARLQKQLADFQARTERVSEGYKALYQRATMMAQSLSQAQQKFLEMQADVARESQEGNLNTAQMASMFAGLGLLLGDTKMAAGGLQASRAFTNEATTNINRQLQQSVQSSVAMTNTWQQGLPDANTIDSIVAGTVDNPTPPANHPIPPAPPSTYQQPPAQQQQPQQQPEQAGFHRPSNGLPAPQESQAFLDGAKDRQEWTNWFAGLSGDAKAGAEFWADKRNDPHWRGRADCAVGEGGTISDDFLKSCQQAKKFLSEVDTRRMGEADFKRGWNSL